MAECFRLLGNATALKLIEALGIQELRVTDLARSAGVSQPLASRRLAILRQGRLVTMRRAGKYTYCKIADVEILAMCQSMREHVVRTNGHLTLMNTSGAQGTHT